tara:strand:+ start:1858 stop:2241 length:384 start_codon:yes stop_codon:yes gene_type:complete
MLVTPLYAAVFALIYVYLSIRVYKLTNQNGICPVGEEKSKIAAEIAKHQSFSEFVVLGLILFFFLEISGGPQVLVHVAAIALGVGRLMTSCSSCQESATKKYEKLGPALSYTSIVAVSFGILYFRYF